MKITGLTDRTFAHTVIRTRPREIHKGDCGRVLIIAGSKEMAGAAVFAACAAIKCGSGLVKVCTARQIFPVLQISVPEATCITWDKIKGDLSAFDAVAIGPGMGVGRRTKNILERVLREYTKTVVIDADGLNTVAGDSRLRQLVKAARAQVIMTPHIGEAKRLLDRGWPADEKGEASKEAVAEALMKAYGCVAVVKGAGTLVADPDGEAYTNTTGNPGMATAGSGDVLTGVITSLAGQGLDPFSAARAGVFLHGLSGDLAAEQTGEYGLTASDIANYVPFAIKELL